MLSKNRKLCHDLKIAYMEQKGQNMIFTTGPGVNSMTLLSKH